MASDDSRGRDAVNAVEVVEAAPGRLAVRGALTFPTARRARELGVAHVGRGGAWRIDCSGVTAADSAGLAVLLDWLAAAARSGGALGYDGLPAELLGIARISEVEELLQRGVGGAEAR